MIAESKDCLLKKKNLVNFFLSLFIQIYSYCVHVGISGKYKFKFYHF